MHSLVIAAILLVLGVLVVAGPLLERILDRIWPPGVAAPRRTHPGPRH